MKLEQIETVITDEKQSIALKLIEAIKDKSVEDKYRDEFMNILKNLCTYKMLIPSGSGVNFK